MLPIVVPAPAKALFWDWGILTFIFTVSNGESIVMIAWLAGKALPIGSFTWNAVDLYTASVYSSNTTAVLGLVGATSIKSSNLNDWLDLTVTGVSSVNGAFNPVVDVKFVPAVDKFILYTVPSLVAGWLGALVASTFETSYLTIPIAPPWSISTSDK